MKEDDMDDMLRKAAENYEVDAGKAADWNFVHNAVHDETEPKPVSEKRKRRFAFWWLLLIPIGWFANSQYNKFHSANQEKNKASIQDQTRKNTDKQPAQANNNTNNTNNTIVNEASKTNKVKSNGSISATHSDKQSKAESKIVNYDNDLNTNLPLLQKEAPDKSLTENADNNSVVSTNIKPDDKKQQSTQLPAINLQNNISTDSNKANNDQQNIAPPTTLASSNKKTHTNQHYFYTGILAGGDLSYVRFQKMQSAGYNLGVLVGYRYNKLSIESGVQLDKKNYYTKGEYFDKSKIPFPDNASLLSVDGYCRMYEIPLNINYTISEKKKHVWFVSAGLSSYLMNKEYYNYAYTQNGYNYKKGYPYFHTTKNWFSVLNLSAGYQLQAGLKSNLRIQPYYKTTLNGVGTGSLSISSMGVNVGITRRIN